MLDAGQSVNKLKILIVDDKNLATFLSVFLYKIKIKIGFGSLHIRHQP